MNVREVALELTTMISHELGVQKAEDIIELYKKCYQGIMEVEGGEILG